MAKKAQSEVAESKMETNVEVLALAIAERQPISGTFVVGPAKHYRKGRLYLEGELITIVNEIPSKTWTPHDSSPKSNAPAAREPSAVNLTLE